MIQLTVVCLTALFLVATGGRCDADEFTVVTEDGTEDTFEAELMGSDQNWHALALASGEYRVVPLGAVRKRVPKAGPVPLTAAEVAKELEQKYTPELFRSSVLGNYVIGLVLATPLPKSSEGRMKSIMARGTRFLKQVETAFAKFLKDAGIPSNKPKYAQVVLIFETDEQFETYTSEVTQKSQSGVRRIAGFYSPITNHLAIRLEECTSFDTPFHEAIHQQVYNCGLLQRLSSVPQWFDEGIATGFEAAGTKVLAFPTRVSPRYAKQAFDANRLSWEEMQVRDDVFRGNVLTTKAYGQAWGLHWLLVTRYRQEYYEYIKILSQKPALIDDSPEERRADFARAFKKPIRELESEFPTALRQAVKKQRIDLEQAKPDGFAMTESKLGKVQMTAIETNGVLRVEGKLTNVSPLRPMSFLVMVLTGTGEFSVWFLDNVGPAKMMPLLPQTPAFRLRSGRSTGNSNTFRVYIRSAPTDISTVADWRRQPQQAAAEILQTILDEDQGG